MTTKESTSDLEKERKKESAEASHNAKPEAKAAGTPGGADNEKPTGGAANDGACKDAVKDGSGSENSGAEKENSADSKEGVGSESDVSGENEGDASGESAEAEQKESEESQDARYMRLAADFKNYKRRAEKEKSDIYAYANEKFALDVIEVMDNFERALAHSDECADMQFVEGIDMIYKQLKNVLDKNNVKEIKAEGEDFDPNFHNAVTSEENPDYESGKVIQALQKGYTLNEKVIRPSMVRVAQ